MQLIDLAGKRFGKLIVLERAAENYVAPCGTTAPRWICLCDCGNIVTVLGKNISSGKSTNCGCVRKITLPASRRTHGDSRGNRLFRIYHDMLSRCMNPKSPSYRWYGNRGIKICSEWLDSYENFKKWALSSGYQDDLTIDRINNDGDYEPMNCQWITPSENSKKIFADKKRRRDNGIQP